jgi:trehalose-phosphatase
VLEALGPMQCRALRSNRRLKAGGEARASYYRCGAQVASPGTRRLGHGRSGVRDGEFAVAGRVGLGACRSALYYAGHVSGFARLARFGGRVLSVPACSFPVWSISEPLEVTAAAAIQYKYMIFRGGRFHRWENLEGNRTLIVSGGEHREVLDSIDHQEPPPAPDPAALAARAARESPDPLVGRTHVVGSIPPSPVFVSSAAQSAGLVTLGPGGQPISTLVVPGSFPPGGSHTVVVVAATQPIASSSTPGVSLQIPALLPGQGLDLLGQRPLFVSLPATAIPASFPATIAVPTPFSVDLADSLEAADAPRVEQLSNTRPEAPEIPPPPAEPSESLSISAPHSTPEEDRPPTPSHEEPTPALSTPPILRADIPLAAMRAMISHLESVPGVIMMCLYLPVRVRHKAGRWVAGWDPEHLLAKQRNVDTSSLNIRYLGIPVVDAPFTEADQDAISLALAPFGCTPVFVEQSVQSQFEAGFCRDTLWGVLHNVIDVYGARATRWWNRERQNTRYVSYKTVQSQFVQALVGMYVEGDMVWVHGHHFLLMPPVIKRHLERYKPFVGIFLHAPFPSSEIFRSLSISKDLLNAMLMADQIGFHVYEYARHFKTCCRRILESNDHEEAVGTDAPLIGTETVLVHGRKVQLVVCHAGIEPSVIKAVLRSAKSREVCQQLRAVLVERDMGSLARIRATIASSEVPDADVVDLHDAAQEEIFHGHPLLPEPLPSGPTRFGAIERRDKTTLISTVLEQLQEDLDPVLPDTPRVTPPATSPAWGPLPSESGVPPMDLLAGFHESQRRLVVGIENLTKLDGIPVKLRAWEALLTRYPWWRSRAVLLQVCIHDHSAPYESEMVLSECRHIAGRINQAFSYGVDGHCFPAVILVERTAPLPARPRTGLLAAADVFVALPLRSGLVHTPLEYVLAASPPGYGVYDAIPRRSSSTDTAPSAAAAMAAAVDDDDGPPITGCDGIGGPDHPSLEEAGALPPSRPGAIVLSEYMACARVVCGALKVNPLRIDQVVAALVTALGMSGTERMARWESSANYVCGASTFQWVERVVKNLNVLRVSGAAMAKVHLGVSNYRTVEFPRSFQEVSDDLVCASFRTANRRVIFTDYGGTLNTYLRPHFLPKSSQGTLQGRADAPLLTHGMKEALRILSDDPRTVVFVMSGKEREVLEHVFADLPNVGLAAEHGFFYRWPANLSARLANPKASGKRSGRWHRLLGACDISWIPLAITILEVYTARTNGTYILRKGSAVAWHYSDADPEFGSMQAMELKDNLNNMLKVCPAEVVSGLNYVEVRPRGVSKGVIAEKLLSLLESSLARAAEAPTPASKVLDAEAARASPMPAPSPLVERRFPLPSSALVSAPPPKVDFVLGLGDDTSDEPMFSTINEWEGKHAEENLVMQRFFDPMPTKPTVGMTTARSFAVPSKPPTSAKTSTDRRAFTATVGQRPSAAKTFIQSPRHVQHLLTRLAWSCKVETGNQSTSDLQSLEKAPVIPGLFEALPSSLSAPIAVDSSRVSEGMHPSPFLESVLGITNRSSDASDTPTPPEPPPPGTRVAPMARSVSGSLASYFKTIDPHDRPFEF